MPLKALLILITHISIAQISFGQYFFFDNTVLDLRDIEVSSKPVNGTFTVTNTGDKDLLILSVASTCGCTTVDWTRTPIRPGRTGRIDIRYTHNGGLGPFEKNVFVRMSDYEGTVNLKVIGEAVETEEPGMSGLRGTIGPLMIRSDRLNAGDVTPGEKKKGYATVYNPTSKDVTLSFSSPSRRLSIGTESQVIPAGSKSRILYTVTTSGYDAGYVEFKPVATIDGRRVSPIIIYASAHNAGARAKAGVDTVFSQANITGHGYLNTFTITNDGEADLVLKRIECPSSRSGRTSAEAGSTVIRPGASTTLTVRGTFRRRGFLDTVRILTNDPDRPELKLFVNDGKNKSE